MTNEEKLQQQVDTYERVLSDLDKWIKSDSVYTLLRYGFKSPSSSGVDECEEERYYIDLFNYSASLRKIDRDNNEAAKANFEQQQP